MSIKRDEMQRAQVRRKQYLKDWKGIGHPSIYSTNDLKAHKKLLGDTQALFLQSCEGAVQEIDLLHLTLNIQAQMILALSGSKPDPQGFYNQALIDEVIDKALKTASDSMPRAERPKSPREDAEGNVQMTVDDAMQEKAADEARGNQEPIAYIGQNPESDPVDVESAVEVLPPSEPNNEDDVPAAKAEAKRSRGGRRKGIKPPKKGGQKAS